MSLFLLLRQVFLIAEAIYATPISSWASESSGAQRFADCAIVITGSAGRIREGFDLLARKQTRKLIVSGVFPQADLREIYPMLPFYGSVQPDDIVLERRARTTFGNAQASLPLVEALKCRDAWLVTSRSHMDRALKTFHSEFPPQFHIYPRAVVVGSSQLGLGEVSVEVYKELYYSLWAY